LSACLVLTSIVALMIWGVIFLVIDWFDDWDR
jgi:hypothetical protein